MTVFVDTSGFYAVLDAADDVHDGASVVWERVVGEEVALVTTNYVLVECLALIQHRLGMAAVRRFMNDIVPDLEVVWIDQATHAAATAAWITAGRRQLSLVDCTSFEVMRREHLDQVFALDAHFSEQGFHTLR